MSKVSITGNNSGTGTFTIAAPNSNTNRTFNLPDEAGTALTDASDLEPQVKTSLNATGDAPLFACRAFCNFDGTGTVSIRDSGNVSSITDNGTGDYTVNFTTAMADASYSVSGKVGAGGSGYGGRGAPDFSIGSQANSIQSSSVRVFSAFGASATSGGGAGDFPQVHVAVFR